MGEAAKHLLFEGFQAGCHVVLRGSNLFDNVSKVSKLVEFSHEMLVLLRPRVSSRVSGFPVALPCLWGKLQNISFSKVVKHVVMSFCVAGAALCDIPTCLMKCRKSFCVARAVLLRPFHKMSCSFRGRSNILAISLVLLRGRRSTPHSTLHPFTSHSTLYIPHFILHTLHSTLYTLQFTLYTLHSTLHTLHSTL